MDNEPAGPVGPAPQEPADAPLTVEPAGFWVRGGALLVDSLILMVAKFIPLSGAVYFVSPAYKTIFVSQGGQTPGKMAAGLKVIRADGEPVSVGRALGRAAAEYLSLLTCGLGYVAAAFGEKRALHDHVAGTRVVYLDGVSRGRRVAFTVLGVVALLSPLFFVGAMLGATGGVGRFKELAVKSKEGANKGGLGMLRSAASIYYGDAEGAYPAGLDALVPKYIESIPAVKAEPHAESTAWTAYGDELCTGKSEYGQELDPAKLKDTGGWGYVADPNSKCWGMIFVDCSHKDTKGKYWTEY